MKKTVKVDEWLHTKVKAHVALTHETVEHFTKAALIGFLRDTKELENRKRRAKESK